MAEKVGPLVAIKKYFEQTDKIAPEGGRKCAPTEITQLSPEDRKVLGAMCAAEMGLELQA